MAEEFRVLRPREYHNQLVSKGQRIDGRRLDQARELKLETNAIKTADASSLVKLGNTSLICGCTARLEYLSKINEQPEDNIKIKVELPPICSGPTGHKMQQTTALLSRNLKNIIQDSKCIDTESLHSDDQIWFIDIEVICLNYDGSLLDASLIAVISALKSLKYQEQLSKSTAVPEIQLSTIPVSLSFAIIGEKIVCDPVLEEETVASSLFTIAIDPLTDKCCHLNKVGGTAIRVEDLFECIQLAKHRAFKLKKVLDSSNNTESIMDCSG